MQLRLYGTQGCHLCDEARAMLEQTGAAYTYFDILDDDALFARYGMQIPVIMRTDGAELGWPFDIFALARFLECH